MPSLVLVTKTGNEEGLLTGCSLIECAFIFLLLSSDTEITLGD